MSKIEQRPTEGADVPEVEFDEYIPVTVVWPLAQRILDRPVYARFRSRSDLLELKFDRESGRIIEAVLVNAPEMRVVDAALGAVPAASLTTAYWVGETEGEDVVDGLDVVAYDDCLLAKLEPRAVISWHGTAPLLFGADESGRLVALAISWSDSERRLVLRVDD